MSTKAKAILITAVFAIAAFPLGPIIWPSAPGMPQPSPAQLPFFAVLAAIESLLFGIGIAFLVLGWPRVRRITGSDRAAAMLQFLSLGWLLVSWWPHDNLHRHIGEEYNGLLGIEYGFHGTVIIASLILAYYFWRTIRDPAATVR